MHPLLIVNPHAGGGRNRDGFERLRGPIERGLGPIDVSFTARPRHAIELAREAALSGREVVVAVGGDGSIHEVVNGLMQAREQGASATRLGIIGQGTGGDWRRTLGIEHRLDRYCAAIAGGSVRTVDVGRFSYVDHGGTPQRAYFVNILSAGIGGLVDDYVAKTTKALGGTVAYFGASLRGLIRSAIGVVDCTVELDGTSRTEQLRTRNVAVCNGRFFGSGMHVAPMALPDDGVFEVIDLGDAPRLRFAAISSKIYSGRHIGSSGVRHFRCNRIAMRLANPDVSDRFPIDVDGEPLGRLPLEIEVVPRALDVLVPA